MNSPKSHFRDFSVASCDVIIRFCGIPPLETRGRTTKDRRTDAISPATAKKIARTKLKTASKHRRNTQRRSTMTRRKTEEEKQKTLREVLVVVFEEIIKRAKILLKTESLL